MVIASIIEATASDPADAAPASTEPVDVEMTGNRGEITTVSPSLLRRRNSKLINTGYWRKPAGSQQRLRFSQFPQANQWGSDGKFMVSSKFSLFYLYLLLYLFYYLLPSISIIRGIQFDQSRVAPLRTSAHHFSFLKVPVPRLQSQIGKEGWISFPHAMPRNESHQKGICCRRPLLRRK